MEPICSAEPSAIHRRINSGMSASNTRVFAPINNLGADERANDGNSVTRVADFVRAGDDDRRGVRPRGKSRSAQSWGVT